jgi:hypothetical protein
MPTYWKAAPYQLSDGSYRQGKIHRISDADSTKTLCGKITAEFAGEILPVDRGAIVDCKVCAKSPLVQARHEAEMEQNRIRVAEWEAQQAAALAQRRQDYEEYLKTAVWASLRERVLKRDRYVCQGCGVAQARDIHHLTYDRLFCEMLFDLVAVTAIATKRFIAN